jgi:hypothetical protein
MFLATGGLRTVFLAPNSTAPKGPFHPLLRDHYPTGGIEPSVGNFSGVAMLLALRRTMM